jgi:isoleucyl-tRNA synthetase
MRRELDLIDVWFDSGAMPFAQQHYPFENREGVDSGELFPADFIAEGVDQTRGWFFTLHAIAGMVKQSVAYKAVISNGLVLDKFGNKMSKRLGNAVDPFTTIEKYGSDPLRWYMISNSAPWDNLKFDEAGIVETSRKFFATLFNTYNFFARYANVDGFSADAEQVPVAQRPEIDRWIISLLNTLVSNVQAALDDYEPTVAARAISEFVQDHLSNWYVRLNRARFWGKEMTADKLAAYQTLYECLNTVALLMAPIAPFYADRLYLDLNPDAVSVHLQLQPTPRQTLIDSALEQRMAMAQQITSMVLALRRKASIKVRQPLRKLMFPLTDEAQRAIVEPIVDLVLSEVNVKEMQLLDPSETVLVKRVKPDFKKLGPVFGKQMKQVAAAVQAMDQQQIVTLERNGAIDLTLADGTTAHVTADTVDIFSEDIPGWLVANEGTLTVALDITVTDELRREGMARDLVNRIQNIRKGRDYNITDHITVCLQPVAEVTDALSQYADYIAAQVLADSITTSDSLPESNDTLDIDGLKVNIEINRI